MGGNLLPQTKLFQVLKESTQWGDMQEIETVGALNDKITKSDSHEVVLVQEALQGEEDCGDCSTDCRQAGVEKVF